MKSLIPCSCFLGGAYLIGLPLQSHIQGNSVLSASSIISVSPSSFPFAPYLHMIIPWCVAMVLIIAGLYFAIQSYRERPPVPEL